MTKKTYIIIGLIALVLIGGYMWWSGMEKAQAPEPQEVAAPVDTVDSIQSDLDAIQIGNVDQDFTEVDQAIKGL